MGFFDWWDEISVWFKLCGLALILLVIANMIYSGRDVVARPPDLRKKEKLAIQIINGTLMGIIVGTFLIGGRLHVKKKLKKDYEELLFTKYDIEAKKVAVPP